MAVRGISGDEDAACAVLSATVKRRSQNPMCSNSMSNCAPAASCSKRRKSKLSVVVPRAPAHERTRCCRDRPGRRTSNSPSGRDATHCRRTCRESAPAAGAIRRSETPAAPSAGRGRTGSGRCRRVRARSSGCHRSRPHSRPAAALPIPLRSSIVTCTPSASCDIPEALQP